jgi:hypothetical protein
MKKIPLALAASAAMLVASGAGAQPYVGAAVGASRSTTSECPCDASGNAWKVQGGYRFGAGFAGEIGYIDFGQANARVFGTNIQAKAAGFTAGAAYEYAFDDRWALGGRLGIARIQTGGGSSFVLNGSGNIDAFVVATEETETAPYYGVVGTFAITRNLKLEAAADWSRAQPAGTTAVVSSMSLGGRYEF